MSEQKLDLITKIQEITGKTPPGLIEVLNLITRPDVIHITRNFLDLKQGIHQCQIFSYPWSCELEAEAKYETMGAEKFTSGTYLDYDQWCQSCRTKEDEKQRRLHGVAKSVLPPADS